MQGSTTGEAVSSPSQPSGVQLSEPPPPWQPRPGWGTIRDYMVVLNDHGGTDIACRFIFDDGSSPTPVVFHDVSSPVAGMSEYARGVLEAGNEPGQEEIIIKVDVATMTRAEDMFQKINNMEAADRVLMYADSTGTFDQFGWAWTQEYKLVKAALGLIN